MATRRVATVFGGSGFIGRYVVKRLAARGDIVRVAVKDPEAALFLKPMGAVGQIVPLYANLANEASIGRAVVGADLVVNLVGILAERRAGDFDRLQAEGPAQIARLSAEAGVQRLVHISAIGADAASLSHYAASKGRGEAALMAAFPSATILRPSLVFGPEDKFFNRFAQLSMILPFMPVIAGDSRFQPVHVGDVADAVMASLERGDATGKIYELGGPRVWRFRELLSYILTLTGRRRLLVDIPMGVARFQATICEYLPGKPLTRDQLLLLTKDNVVAEGANTLQDLGLSACPVELAVPGYLSRFRSGGRRQSPVLG